MATANPLDEFLIPEADESAISALVGALESQLASPTNKDPSQQHTTVPVDSNHVNNRQVTDTNSATVQIGSGKNTLTQHLPGSQLSTTNSIVTKSVNESQQIMGINSIVTNNSNTPGSPAVPILSGTNSPSTAHAVTTNNGQIVVPGMTSSPHTVPQTLQNTTGVRTIVYSTVNNTTNCSPVPTVSRNAQVIPNPQTTQQTNSVGNVVAAESSASNAMYNLASIAAEQKPLAVGVENALIKTQKTGTGNKLAVETTAQAGEKKVIISTSAPKPQFVIKQEPGKPVQIKQEGISNSVAVNQQTKTVHIVNVSSKGSGSSNSNVITVNAQQPSIPGVKPLSNVSTVGVPRAVTSGMVTTAGHKILAPRVVQTPIRIASPAGQQPALAPRPGTVGNTITLPPGFQLPPGAVLMKNEHGQIVMVQSTPGQQLIQPQGSAGALGAQYRFPPKPGIGAVRPVMTSSSTSIPSPLTVVSQVTSATTQVPGGAPPIRTVVHAVPPGAVAQPHTVMRAAQPQTSTAPTQNPLSESMMENVKKCKNFLSTLIKLAANQPPDTVRSVKELIQGLIDGRIEPEKFTIELQTALKSSPQPYLVPFLKKSLPLLRQLLAQKSISIDGVQAPPTNVTPRPNAKPQATPGIPLTVSAVSSGAAAPGQTVLTLPQQVTQLGQGNIQAGQQKYTLAELQAMHKAKQKAVDRQPGGQNKPNVMPTTVTALQARVNPTQKTVSSPHHKDKRKYESLKDDDDINDDINNVATMGGVNLSEESRNILATTAEFASTQLRSCKDEAFLNTGLLMQRINRIARARGLEDTPSDVINLVSHATQERLRNILERLSTIAEHRLEIYKTDSKHESTTDVKGQLKFIEELDRLEKKRHDEQEREYLLKVAKSRSKNEDPEQLKLKQKAKELQAIELEKLRQQEANQTALAAIGPRKKRKLDGTDSPQAGSSSASNGHTSVAGSSSSRPSLLRPRIKRVNLRDIIFLLEQDRESNKSSLLYKAFLK